MFCAGCDGFFCTVPQVTPNRRRACWIAVFSTHGRHEQHERADENGGSPTLLEPFAPDMMRIWQDAELSVTPKEYVPVYNGCL